MKLVLTEKLKPGDLCTGTEASGHHFPQPKRLDRLELAPEHAQRTTAYRLTWTDGTSLVYYADTMVWVAQRPGRW